MEECKRYVHNSNNFPKKGLTFPNFCLQLTVTINKQSKSLKFDKMCKLILFLGNYYVFLVKLQSFGHLCTGTLLYVLDLLLNHFD